MQRRCVDATEQVFGHINNTLPGQFRAVLPRPSHLFQLTTGGKTGPILTNFKNLFCSFQSRLTSVLWNINAVSLWLSNVFIVDVNTQYSGISPPIKSPKYTNLCQSAEKTLVDPGWIKLISNVCHVTFYCECRRKAVAISNEWAIVQF